MSWVSAVVSVAAAQQASAAGKFNQAIQNRNAQIAEQEAQLIEKQSEFDLAQFDKKFARFQGETKTKILNSGVELSGSGLRILRANAEQAELEKDIPPEELEEFKKNTSIDTYWHGDKGVNNDGYFKHMTNIYENYKKDKNLSPALQIHNGLLLSEEVGDSLSLSVSKLV